jgi:hypothetical protein
MWPPLSDDLRKIIRSDDLSRLNDRLSQHPPLCEEELNRCLIFAMSEASIDTIDGLIRWGAKMTEESFYTAIDRGNPALLQLMVDNDWYINSTAYGPTALE